MKNDKEKLLACKEDKTKHNTPTEKLTTSADCYLNLFENISAMIWKAGVDRKCSYFNNSWLDFTGRTLEQEIGDGWSLGVHPEDMDRCYILYSEAFISKQPFEMEYRLKNKDGQYRWILDMGKPFCDMNNEFSGYIGTCFDITQKKIAEEGLKRYQLLLQNANDIILFADINGYVIEANDASVRAYGYEKEELLGRSIFFLVSPDPGLPVGGGPYNGDSGGIYYEATAYRKDGSTFAAEVSMQAGELSGSKVLMAIARDVTERKRINEELKQAKESAETANRAKSQFLANMSHEIRTPLNGIVGMIDLTLLTHLTEEQEDNLCTAKECAGALVNLMGDILDFSKVEAGKLTMENIDFNIRDILEQTVKPHAIKAREKCLRIQCRVDDKIPRLVNGDPYRFKQVVNNLVGNAVKFTDWGEVAISAELMSETNESMMLEFQVSDTGIGIAFEDTEKLFNSFSQVDSSHTRKYGGTGLGLAISKRLIEMMGGTIRVDSAKGKGSTFYFTVKFKSSNSEAETCRPIGRPERAGPPRRILLVEDDKINQVVVSRMIKETGHESIIANNGKEALQILGDENIDVVLMDIHMPEMDGIETTRVIRRSEKAKGGYIPIIALTAYALKGDREKFLALGMDGYISKPVQISTLVETVESVVGKLKAGKAGSAERLYKDYNELNRIDKGKFMSEQKKSMQALLIDIDKNINLLKSTFEENDLTSIERHAQEIKRLASEIGAEGIKRAAFKLQLAARSGSMEQAAECMSLLVLENLKQKNTGYENGW